jgi:hypothetical protein
MSFACQTKENYYDDALELREAQRNKHFRAALERNEITPATYREYPFAVPPVQEDQLRIQAAANERQALNEPKKTLREMLQEGLEASSSTDEAEFEDSPVIPRRTDSTVKAKSKAIEEEDSDDLKETDDGNIYFPAKGQPFRVVRHFDILSHIQPLSPDEQGTKETGSGITPSECEKVYRENNNSVSHLLVMCIGLCNDNERPLADFEQDELYQKYLDKSFVPKVPLLKWEMQRRASLVGITKLRKASVLKPDAILWLKNNPVKGKANIRFLLKYEEELYKAM